MKGVDVGAAVADGLWAGDTFDEGGGGRGGIAEGNDESLIEGGNCGCGVNTCVDVDNGGGGGGGGGE